MILTCGIAESGNEKQFFRRKSSEAEMVWWSRREWV
jgi:hypothetical protein